MALMLALCVGVGGLETRGSLGSRGKPVQNVRLPQALKLDAAWKQVMCLEEGDCSGKAKTTPGKYDAHKLWSMIKDKEEPLNKAGPGDKHLIGDLLHRLKVNFPLGSAEPVAIKHAGGVWTSDAPTANVEYDGGVWVGDRGSPAKDATVLKAMAKKMVRALCARGCGAGRCRASVERVRWWGARAGGVG